MKLVKTKSFCFISKHSNSDHFLGVLEDNSGHSKKRKTANSVGLFCYFNTLGAGFVFDDNRAIVENADVSPKMSWANMWVNDFWGTPLSHSGSHKSYRPLCILSFRINYLLDGLNPRGYHSVNVLLHSVTSGVFTLFALRLLGNSMQSLIAGLLFAVHPVHTEAVAGIVGRADVGAGLFFILSLIFYQRACQSATLCSKDGIDVFFLASMACCVAATLTKELGITVLGVMIVYDALFVTDIKFNANSLKLKKAVSRGTLQRLVALSITGGSLLYLRFSLMNLSPPVFASSDNPAANHDDVITRFLTFLYLPVVNIALLLFPWQLSFDWSMDSIPLVTSFDDSRNIASASLYSCLVYFAHRFLRSRVIFERSSFGNIGTDSSEKKQMKLGRNLDNKHEYYRLSCDTLVPGCCKQTHKSQNESEFYSNGNIFQNGVTNHNGSNKKNGSQRTNNIGSYSAKSTVDNKGLNYGKNKSGTQKQNGICLVNRLGNSSCSGHIQEIAVENDITNKNTFRNFSSDKGNVQNGFFAERDDFGNRLFENRFRTKGLLDENVRNSDGESLILQNEPIDELNIAVLALAMVIIPFIPASNLLFYVGFVVAERILYIPSMGFCLLVALGFGRIWKHSKPLRPFLKIGVFVIIGLLAARTLVRNEEWKDEESLYRSGVKVNPPKAFGNLASILMRQGKIAEAEQAYKKALEYRPNMADTQYNLGILYQNSKRFDKAIDCYKNAIEYRPTLASAYLNLGLVYDMIGRKQEAIQILSNSKNISDFGLKNPKAHLHSLIAIRYNLGKILFDMRKYKESVGLFNEALEITPQSYSSHSIYNMLGQAYSFLGKADVAEKWYLKSLEANQTHVPAHLTYARHLAQKGNAAAAEKWFLKALKLQPMHYNTHFHYGQFLISIGRKEEGLSKLETAMELNENDPELAAFTASAFREAKEYVKAESYYKKAIMLKPNAAHNHMNLGALYHLTGRLEEAEASYIEALRLSPGDKLTITNIKKLRSIRSQENL